MGHRDFTKLLDSPFVASLNYTPFNGRCRTERPCRGHDQICPLVADGKVYQATYDNQLVVYGLGAASVPVRDIRRTVVFIYGQTHSGQDMFVRGGTKSGGPFEFATATG